LSPLETDRLRTGFRLDWIGLADIAGDAWPTQTFRTNQFSKTEWRFRSRFSRRLRRLLRLSFVEAGGAFYLSAPSCQPLFSLPLSNFRSNLPRDRRFSGPASSAGRRTLLEAAILSRTFLASVSTPTRGGDREPSSGPPSSIRSQRTRSAQSSASDLRPVENLSARCAPSRAQYALPLGARVGLAALGDRLIHRFTHTTRRHCNPNGARAALTRVRPDFAACRRCSGE
jgi:hypothetical protein